MIKKRAYFCKGIAIQTGGVWRYFSKVWGSGVDLTLPFFPKPKVEPEPPEPFSRNRNRNRNRPSLLNCTETQKAPFCRGTARTENRKTARNLSPPNRNRTEPNRGLPERVVSKRVVLADLPPKRKPERGYVRMFPWNEKPERGYVRTFPRNENRNEGKFAKSTLLRNRPLISR